MSQLYGVEMFTVGPWAKSDFDGQPFPGWFSWYNSDSFSKKFIGFDISMGAEGASLQDFGVVLHDYTLTDPIICQVGWDRYTDPTASITTHINFGQGHFAIGPGGRIDMYVLYIPFSDTPLVEKKVAVKVVGRYLL